MPGARRGARARAGRAPPSRSPSSTARWTAISRTLEQVLELRRPGGDREPRLPAVLRPARGARARRPCRWRSTSTGCVPAALSTGARARSGARGAPAAARAQPDRRLDDRGPRAGAGAHPGDAPRRRRRPWSSRTTTPGSSRTAPDVSLGRWLPERVIHVRSFSKSHGPDLRIAALGGPSAVIDRDRRPPDARAGVDLADAAAHPATTC